MENEPILLIANAKNTLHKDILYYLFDMIHDFRDVESLIKCSTLNKHWRGLINARRRKYFYNYWTVAYLVTQNIILCKTLQESILDLLLVRLELAPHRADIASLVRQSELLRVDSLEDLSMPLCLDELVPDDSPNGNGQIYVCNNQATMRRTIVEIITWMRDYLYIDLFPNFGSLEITPDFHVALGIWGPIETQLDDFYYTLLDNIGADEVQWTELYEVYTNDSARGSHKITNILNKIKIIYFLLDIYIHS